jgi:hypothetical protein
MRSTRHKLKMLRGISRPTTANGSDGGACSGLPYRKHVHYQHSANFHRHSSADSPKSNNNSQHQNKNPFSNSANNQSHSEVVQNGSRSPRSKPYNQHPGAYFVSTSASLNLVNIGENNNLLSEQIQSLTWTEIHSSTTSTMDCQLNSDIRAKAFAICKDYLHGVWKQIDARDLIVKRIRYQAFIYTKIILYSSKIIEFA